MVLLYLLDVFAGVAFHSESNNMTSWRLAALFQPMILSPVKAGEYVIEEDKYSVLSQGVLTLLIESIDLLLLEDMCTYSMLR